MKDYNYYKEQLEKINIDSIYPVGVKFFAPENESENTKQMNLNLESIPEIRKFLDRVESEILKG